MFQLIMMVMKSRLTAFSLFVNPLYPSWKGGFFKILCEFVKETIRHTICYLQEV
jgi:hypothetical protein